MTSNNMKNTEYYESGKMHEANKNANIVAQKSINNLKAIRIECYLLDPSTCKQCNTALSYANRKLSFCNTSCSATFHNEERRKNNKKRDVVSRSKTAESIKLVNKPKIANRTENYNQSPTLCQICDIPLPYEKRHYSVCESTDCQKECRRRHSQKGGLKSASLHSKRSKHEIEFYDLCNQTFNRVTNNDPIFDGWDADVLIHDYKIAVLWNGDWHYQEMNCYNHSLKQVENRDSYKAKLIDKHGWHLYIIKDTTNAPTNPVDALVILKEWISSKFGTSVRYCP